MPDNLEQNQQPAQPEGQPQPTAKIFGKYEDMSAAEQGYYNAVKEMNDTKQKLGMAVELIEKLRGQGQPQPQPQTPAYEQQLERYGVPVEAIREMVKAIAQETSQSVVSSQLTPLASGAKARQTMGEKYADYQQNEAKVMQFVKSQPELAQRFEELLAQNRPFDALEIGYFNWRASQPVQPAQDPTKTAAGMPGGAGAAARTPQGMQMGSKEERLQQAAKFFADTRNFEPLIQEQLADVPLSWSEHMDALARQGR